MRQVGLLLRIIFIYEYINFMYVQGVRSQWGQETVPNHTGYRMMIAAAADTEKQEESMSLQQKCPLLGPLIREFFEQLLSLRQLS